MTISIEKKGFKPLIKINDEQLLLPVIEFSPTLLPKGPIREYVVDMANNLQCPQDFIAVSLVTALAAVNGRSHQLLPNENNDTWKVVGNLWAVIIGEPSLMKSPAINSGLKYIKSLEKKHGNQQRFMTNDATVEALGKIMSENPNGILLSRDEISGFFEQLNDKSKSNYRAFFLESFSGDGSYTFDRITREKTTAEFLVLSIIGSIQPDLYRQQILNSTKSKYGNDGFIQRFQLAVYPNMANNWVKYDKPPNKEARDGVEKIFLNIFELANSIDPEYPHYFKFDDDAQVIFDDWRDQLENTKLRNTQDGNFMVSHLTKYRSLMPSLALILHLIATQSNSSPISKKSTLQAREWCDYLETHARRIYEMSLFDNSKAIQTLIKKIINGDLTNSFCLRDFDRKNWAHLNDREKVVKALKIIEKNGYIKEVITESKGKKIQTFEINPELNSYEYSYE